MKDLVKNKLFLIGVGVLALIVVIAIVAVIALGVINKNSKGQLIVDTSNPVTAADLLNKFILTTAQSLPVGEVDPNNVTSDLVRLGLPAIQGPVSSVEFSLGVTMAGKTELKANFTGFVKDAGDGKYDMSLDGTLTNAAGSVLPLTVLSVGGEYYFKLGTIPSDVLNDLIGGAAGGLDSDLSAQYAAYFAKLENQWVKGDSTATSLIGGTASTTVTIKDSEKQDLIKKLTDSPVFINAKAAESRTLGSDKLGCMTVEVNPALDTDQSTVKSLGPIELCTKGENQLPVLVGLNIKDSGDGTTGSVEIGVLSYNKNLPLTAPTDAKSIQDILIGM